MIHYHTPTLLPTVISPPSPPHLLVGVCPPSVSEEERVRTSCPWEGEPAVCCCCIWINAPIAFKVSLAGSSPGDWPSPMLCWSCESSRRSYERQVQHITCYLGNWCSDLSLICLAPGVVLHNGVGLPRKHHPQEETSRTDHQPTQITKEVWLRILFVASYPGSFSPRAWGQG